MKKIYFLLIFTISLFSGVHLSIANEQVTAETIFLQPQAHRPGYGFYRSDLFRSFGLSRSPFFAQDYTRESFLSGYASPSRSIAVRAIRVNRPISASGIANATKPSAPILKPIFVAPKAKIYRVTVEKITPSKIRIIRGSAR